LAATEAALGGVGAHPAHADLQEASQQMPAVPTSYLHGVTDGCVGPEVASLAERAAPDNVRIERVGGAGHLLHREQPADVNRQIIDHLIN
jgi:pimeloyl-ACP methyl ester carboxylesterase